MKRKRNLSKVWSAVGRDSRRMAEMLEMRMVKMVEMVEIIGILKMIGSERPF